MIEAAQSVVEDMNPNVLFVTGVLQTAVGTIWWLIAPYTPIAASTGLFFLGYGAFMVAFANWMDVHNLNRRITEELPSKVE